VWSGWCDAGKLLCIHPRVDRQGASGKEEAETRTHAPESKAL